MIRARSLALATTLLAALPAAAQQATPPLTLADAGYFEGPGVNVLAFSNWYDGLFADSKIDFAFIAGGLVPGVLVLKPDYPENHEDWPFFWGENEYVIPEGSGWIQLAGAVNALAGQ